MDFPLRPVQVSLLPLNRQLLQIDLPWIHFSVYCWRISYELAPMADSNLMGSQNVNCR